MFYKKILCAHWDITMFLVKKKKKKNCDERKQTIRFPSLNTVSLIKYSAQEK